MHAQLISIGNSKGIRIPAALLRQYNIQDEVEICPGKDEIILRPITRIAREGWDSAFSAMHTAGDDSLLIDDALDLEAWEWK
jgi:antitoxin MazE